MSDEGRFAAITLNIGAKKTGKTTAVLQLMGEMHLLQSKPSLVLNIGNQPAYEKLHEISLNDIKHFNRLAEANWGNPLFRCHTTDVDDFMLLVDAYVKNACVVFEDATSYMGGNLSKPKMRLVLNSRNIGNDYVFNLHSLSDPAPFLWKHADYLLLRQTWDDPNKLPDKVAGNRPRIIQAMRLVRAENERLYPRPEQPRLASARIALQEL